MTEFLPKLASSSELRDEKPAMGKKQEMVPTMGPFFDSPEKRMRIQNRTHELIEVITENDARVIVFLDRSARPLSWMLRAAWKKGTSDFPMPKIKFINIGREKVPLYPNRPPQDERFEDMDDWVEAVTEYWSRLESEKYVVDFQRDIGASFTPNVSSGKSASDGCILLVDDFKGSGFTCELATNFFEHHFPNRRIRFHPFFNQMDSLVFKGRDWAGTHLPWNTDKSLTLLSADEDHPKRILAKAERDPELRKRGLSLKREIEEIFEQIG